MGFFDGLTNKVQETTNKMQKESKLKKSISDNNSKIEKTYSEMGKKIFEEKKVNAELEKYFDEDRKSTRVNSSHCD